MTLTILPVDPGSPNAQTAPSPSLLALQLDCDIRVRTIRLLSSRSFGRIVPHLAPAIGRFHQNEHSRLSTGAYSSAADRTFSQFEESAEAQDSTTRALPCFVAWRCLYDGCWFCLQSWFRTSFWRSRWC